MNDLVTSNEAKRDGNGIHCFYECHRFDEDGQGCCWEERVPSSSKVKQLPPTRQRRLTPVGDSRQHQTSPSSLDLVVIRASSMQNLIDKKEASIRRHSPMSTSGMDGNKREHFSKRRRLGLVAQILSFCVISVTLSVVNASYPTVLDTVGDSGGVSTQLDSSTHIQITNDTPSTSQREEVRGDCEEERHLLRQERRILNNDDDKAGVDGQDNCNVLRFRNFHGKFLLGLTLKDGIDVVGETGAVNNHEEELMLQDDVGQLETAIMQTYQSLTTCPTSGLTAGNIALRQIQNVNILTDIDIGLPHHTTSKNSVNGGDEQAENGNKNSLFYFTQDDIQNKAGASDNMDLFDTRRNQRQRHRYVMEGNDDDMLLQRRTTFLVGIDAVCSRCDIAAALERRQGILFEQSEAQASTSTSCGGCSVPTKEDFLEILQDTVYNEMVQEGSSWTMVSSIDSISELVYNPKLDGNGEGICRAFIKDGDDRDDVTAIIGDKIQTHETMVVLNIQPDDIQTSVAATTARTDDGGDDDEGEGRRKPSLLRYNALLSNQHILRMMEQAYQYSFNKQNLLSAGGVSGTNNKCDPYFRHITNVDLILPAVNTDDNDNESESTGSFIYNPIISSIRARITFQCYGCDHDELYDKQYVSTRRHKQRQRHLSSSTISTFDATLSSSDNHTTSWTSSQMIRGKHRFLVEEAGERVHSDSTIDEHLLCYCPVASTISAGVTLNEFFIEYTQTNKFLRQRHSSMVSLLDASGRDYEENGDAGQEVVISPPIIQSVQELIQLNSGGDDVDDDGMTCPSTITEFATEYYLVDEPPATRTRVSTQDGSWQAITDRKSVV